MPRWLLLLLAVLVAGTASGQDAIPLPEHPRPDFERPDWINLNGPWGFAFDAADQGVEAGWHLGAGDFSREILVPFPWGSPRSGVPDSAQIGWYARTITVPEAWAGRRVFLVIGAADWHTTAWLDGQDLGWHQGGYTPFAFELTAYMTPGTPQQLTLRIDDQDRAYKLEGKQGYGNARGIWQTVYLEARGAAPLATVHATPDLEAEAVTIEARLLEPAPADLTLRLSFPNGEAAPVTEPLPRGTEVVSVTIPLPAPRRWTLTDPYLYALEAQVSGGGLAPDVVRTYFGMREISVVDLPGTDYRYVALNGEPVYLQLALDQAYHPEGYYTFPDDAFLRDEVLRARQIGLNGLRVHVKIAHPRKLYWADRLGMLVMADVPNAWGEPIPSMQQEVTYALEQMIRRDYNHPSIFAWVPFNETWGLRTTVPTEDGGTASRYLPETQQWVAEVVAFAKALDPTRLVEDNSVCCGVGHTVTDLNSWHAYLPGWAWEEHLREISAGTYPGSTWNFEPGYRQDRQPNINSEFGNVWGYEGSTGDVDWSWDYHRAINAFRRHPKIAGWLYTEHHDVINEWNGYWRYDRSEKFTGLEELAEGMTLRDLHAPVYLAVGDPAELARTVQPGEAVAVPLFLSAFTDADHGGTLTLAYELYGWTTLGARKRYAEGRQALPFRPWMQEALPPLSLTMPDEPGVFVLVTRLLDATGVVLHRNFTTFVAPGQPAGPMRLGEDGLPAHVLRVPAAEIAGAEWSGKQWTVLDGLKLNGAGHGYVEYRLPWPDSLAPADVGAATFLVEASAKQLYDKDREDAGAMGGDYMRGQGTLSPHRNPNAYPMTDETPFPSAVRVTVNGHDAGRYELPDDPADHRGILSWHAQRRDRRLREAGSYGYLLQVPIPRAALEAAAAEGAFVVRLSVSEALPGGLAIYGARFGRYPLDPTVILTRRP